MTSDASAHIELTVNGQLVSAVVSEAATLLQLLRHDLGRYGVRAGCTMGECGSCTVLVDGEPARCCQLPATAAAGRSVTTPEGLGTPDAPHPVQQAFLDTQAAQCGYCLNGIIMTVAARARAGAAADTDPRELLADHLCRCGAHGRVLAATERALGLAPGGWVTDGGTVPAGGATSTTARSATGGPPDPVPSAVAADPRVERWLELSGGRVRVLSGKVELGQGIRTAVAQIVAAVLGVPLAMVDVVPTTTGRSPDQWYTAGSQSVEEGGVAVAMAAAAFRRLLLERVADRTGRPGDELTVTPEGVRHPAGVGMSWAEVEGSGPVTGVIDPTDLPDWRRTPIGSAVPRDDLRVKLTGAPAFLQDLTMPGMLHARVLLPPHPDSLLETLHPGVARGLPGVVEVVPVGRAIMVIAEREEQAIRAVQRLARDARWSDPPALPADPRTLLRTVPADTLWVRRDEDIDERLTAGRQLRATYGKPYQAHGSIAPSAAVARVDGDTVRVWCHSQGVYPLRRELSALFGIDQERLQIQHVDGPGCYGQNGADDAAAFAVAAARAVPGRPVRLQFAVADEFGWEPYGPAMLVDLAASLSDQGRILAWRHRSFSDAHVTRPNGDGNRLALQWLRDGDPRPLPGAHEAGARNGTPLYDVPTLEVGVHQVTGPVRTGPLRTLGSYMNVFAGESFMDELAEAAGCDPVEFRLRHLSDPRARRVLEVVADRAGWQPHVGPSGRGRGVALTRYKGSRAYVALVVDVSIDEEARSLRVGRVWAACDAGTVINPDGLRNQVEGGIVQGISRALFEASSLGPTGVVERDWTSYRTLRFTDVPRMEVVLVAQDTRPLGVGESSSPPVPAAIANAVDDASGVRLRELPLTVAQAEHRMLTMDGAEVARVRL